MLRTNVDNNGNLGISSSGSDGAAGRDGCDGTYAGAAGERGFTGQFGQNAMPINISLRANTIQQTVAIGLENGTEFQLPIGATISLTANGGNGGMGGKGGHGANGYRGRDGDDATRNSWGTDGKDGGPGGDGGAGGAGGNGGAGANTSVKVDESDSDLFMLVSSQNRGGRGGEGGEGGHGGEGGPGGRGGSPYYWDEIVDNGYDDNGNAKTYTITHSNPGGSNGSSGADGFNGRHGDVGRKGSKGTYCLTVGATTYIQRYDLALSDFLNITSDDKIIEPGESLAVSNLTFHNPTSMPTPASVDVTLRPTKWLEFNPADTLTIARSILPNQCTVLNEPLHFTIPKKLSGPAVDSTFAASTDIEVLARLPRVNIFFQHVMPQSVTLPIRYPVELSQIGNTHSITSNEEAPVTFTVRNISSQSLGTLTLSKRPVTVTFSVIDGVDGEDMQLLDVVSGATCKLAAPCVVNLGNLAAGSNYTFASTLKFMNSSTPVYTTVNCRIDLGLGKLDAPNDIEIIQSRNIQVQLAERYTFDPESDFVIVANQKTDAKTINRWQSLIMDELKAKKRPGVWNTSYYGGLSYEHKRADMESFMSQLSGKVVIILNNEFIDDNNKKIHATDYLDLMEILNAAKKANISTYVVGEHFNLKDATTPLSEPSKSSQPEVKESFMFWHQPKVKHLSAKAELINKELRKQNPVERNVAVVDFDPVYVKGLIFREWKLGSIDARSALPRDQAHVAYRQDNVNSVDERDLYTLIKLLPFSQKLNLLVRCIDKSKTAELIGFAILSDLTNEMLAFGHDTWKGEFSEKKLSFALSKLNTLMDYDFGKFCTDVTSKYFLMNLILKYELLVKKLPDAADKYLFPMYKLRTIISDVCTKKIDKMIKEYFSNDEIDVKHSRVRLQKRWRDTSKESLYRQFSSPLSDNIQYDNDNKEDEITLKHELPEYQRKKSSFRECGHFFSSNQERAEQTKVQEQVCRFDLDVPPESFGLKK